AAWLILQFAEVTFEPFGIPDWSMRALVIAAIAGVPVTFALAWVIDVRPEGLIFDLPLWTAGGARARPPKRSDWVYAALLAGSLTWGAFLAADLLLDDLVQVDSTPLSETGVDRSRAQAPANSIAVLAFENFDGRSESDYFAAGLAEEILNLLAARPELRVAARTSSFRFQGERLDIREVAALLGVRHVLEGSVRRSGDRIRVTAQLIDGNRGYHDWSKTYDRELADIFALQDELAAAVVNELSLALAIEPGEPAQRPTGNVEAYVFYLEGRGRLRASLDADVNRAAATLFRNALAIDPGFARAWSGLCQAQLQLYSIGRNGDDFTAAKDACERAAELDGAQAAEVALALGKLYRYRGQLDTAEQYLERAMAAEPSEPDAYIEMGEIRDRQQQQEDAERFFRRAVDLKRNYWAAHSALGMFYFRGGRYQDSADAFEVATRLAPDVASAFAGKGAAYALLGERSLSRAAYDASLALKPSRQAYTNMGLRYYYDGLFVDAADMQRRALEYAPEDHRVWGRLAESLRFVDGADQEADDAYATAARHAQAMLKVNDQDWETTGLLGIYLVHLGRLAEAQTLVERAVALSDRAPAALYFQALVLQQSEDSDGTLRALEAAIAADPGYRDIVAEDPDLAELATTARFRALLETPPAP
ncbi:MAG: tetratricopeptide repeat protein, partial [Pseudomonadota bacterium]